MKKILVIVFIVTGVQKTYCQTTSEVFAELSDNAPAWSADSVIEHRTTDTVSSNESANKSNQRQAYPRDVLKMSGGPSWIVSEIETPSRIYKSKLGYSFSADYQHLWRRGFGIGANFMYFGTSFDEKFDMRMIYFGPSFVCHIVFGQKWRWDSSLGLGFSRYTEKMSDKYYNYYHDYYTPKSPRSNTSYSENRFGTMLQTGLEYMLSKSVGIGLQVTLTTTSLKKPEGHGDKYDFYGIRRIDPQIGLRCYL